MQYNSVIILGDGLAEIPLLDVHTHIDASHLQARGLHDILLYHMVISDLVSAGCPSRNRLSDEPDDVEAEPRLVEAIPYLRYIQNTSCFWECVLFYAICIIGQNQSRLIIGKKLTE